MPMWVWPLGVAAVLVVDVLIGIGVGRLLRGSTPKAEDQPPISSVARTRAPHAERRSPVRSTRQKSPPNGPHPAGRRG
jgi:hypothetical protein